MHRKQWVQSPHTEDYELPVTRSSHKPSSVVPCRDALCVYSHCNELPTSVQTSAFIQQTFTGKDFVSAVTPTMDFYGKQDKKIVPKMLYHVLVNNVNTDERKQSDV